MDNNEKSQFFSTREAIKKWLDKNYVKNYTINDDLSVDVNGNVNISDKKLKTIPVKFGNVTGGFWCNHNELTMLIRSAGKPTPRFQRAVVQGVSRTQPVGSLATKRISTELTSLAGSPVKHQTNIFLNIKT